MKLALIGEYNPDSESHRQTDAAIQHSAAALGLQAEAEWISTTDPRIAEDLSGFDGQWIVPGSPYGSFSGALAAIRWAWGHAVPCFGTCGGFQHMVIEFARSVANIDDAQHAEYDPYASKLIVSRLACSLVGREMQVSLVPGSKAAAAYGTSTAQERYYCNFGLNPDYLDALTAAGLAVSGADADGEPRIIEIPGHPFFVGTLFVPQARSTPGSPHPLVNAFLAAAAEKPGRPARESG